MLTVIAGWDETLSKQNPSQSLPGGYCIVPNISEDEDQMADSQTITCYFPCNAA